MNRGLMPMGGLLTLTAVVSMLSLAAAEQEPALFALVLGGALLSMVIGVGPGKAPLPRLIVNLLYGAAVLVLLLKLLDEDEPISDIAQFLLLVLLIKSLDRRDVRDEGQVLGLSVFVVIGAMLSGASLAMGLLLALYIPLAIASAMRFQIRLGEESLRRAAAGMEELGVRGAAPAPAAGARAAGHLRALQIGSIIASLAIALGVFVVAPRGLPMGLGAQWGEGSASRITGFSDTVQLGQPGLIRESLTPVLTLEVTDSAGQNIGSRTQVFYLRGATSDRYRNGEWTTRERDLGPSTQREGPVRLDPGERLGIADAGADPRVFIRQRIRILASSGSEPIFAVWRPLELVPEDRADVILTDADLVLRRSDARRGAFEYEVLSAADARAPQTAPSISPAFASGPIRDLAASLLEAEGIPLDPAQRQPAQDRQAARALQRHFQQGFAYTLDIGLPPGGAARQDPIEWFLFTEKRGHCEYYASAMVALCQSVGLPARLVSGYVAAEYDNAQQHYVVRQSNAHAWVEVELDPGRWEVFDPTPPADLARLHRAGGGFASTLRRWYESLELQWASGVISFSNETRARILGSDPARASFLERMRDRATDAMIRMRQEGVVPALRNLATRAVPILLLAIGIYLVLRALRLIPRNLLARLASREAPDRLAIETGYARALRALRRAGLEKPRWRPPLEHADAVDAAAPAVGQAFRGLALAYYAARFGGETLDPQVLERLRDSARQIERSLDRPARR